MALSRGLGLEPGLGAVATRWSASNCGLLSFSILKPSFRLAYPTERRTLRIGAASRKVLAPVPPPPTPLSLVREDPNVVVLELCESRYKSMLMERELRDENASPDTTLERLQDLGSSLQTFYKSYGMLQTLLVALLSSSAEVRKEGRLVTSRLCLDAFRGPGVVATWLCCLEAASLETTPSVS